MPRHGRKTLLGMVHQTQTIPLGSWKEALKFMRAIRAESVIPIRLHRLQRRTVGRRFGRSIPTQMTWWPFLVKFVLALLLVAVVIPIEGSLMQSRIALDLIPGICTEGMQMVISLTTLCGLGRRVGH